MSFTRMPYDTCNVSQQKKQTTDDPVQYQFFGGKYRNSGLCNEMNTVCDLPLSSITLKESILLNLDKKNTKCKGGQFKPQCSNPPCSLPNSDMFMPIRVFDRLAVKSMEPLKK